MWKKRSPLSQRLLLGGCLLLPLVGCGGSAASTVIDQLTSEAPSVEETAVETPTGSGTAIAACEQAADEGKYVFAFFWKTGDDTTAAMRRVFDQTVAKVTDRARAIAVNVTDPAEKGIVERYDLDRAPMPLVLAVAPNGAITGGFPTQFSEQDLLSAFATPATQQCMKLLQDGKLVLLCVQNKQTNMNDDAMQGVTDFAADDRFRSSTEIVAIDPADELEKPFLTDLQVDPATKTAITVFLAPPGSPIAKFEGTTTKDQFLAELQQAGACGPDGVCGPGGCAPQ